MPRSQEERRAQAALMTALAKGDQERISQARAEFNRLVLERRLQAAWQGWRVTDPTSEDARRSTLRRFVDEVDQLETAG